MRPTKLLSSFLLSLLSLLFTISIATDTITINQIIRDGETIISSSGNFELGFFSPKTSNFRYLGIWYKFSNEAVVWVANREMPLGDTTGILVLTRQRIMVLNNLTNSLVWSSNYTVEANNPVAQLLDAGNLVITEAGESYNEDHCLWQSFDFPSDTFLPSMKFGKNFATGKDWSLVSWKSTSDPSLGISTARLDPHGFPEMYIWIGEKIVYRTGPWNGLRFSGMPLMKQTSIYTHEVVFNEKEMYYRYGVMDKSIVMRLVLSNQGMLQRLTWNNSSKIWNLNLNAQMDFCDKYAACGAFGGCNISNSPTCACLKGFIPKMQRDWDAGDWSSGCVRSNELVCSVGEGFQKIPGVKLPATDISRFNRTMDLTECEMVCLRNCSCTAYAVLNIKDGSGCLLWFGDLIDIEEYSENGQDIYIRLANSELDTSGSSSKMRVTLVWTTVGSGLALFIASLVLWLILNFKRKRTSRHNVAVEIDDKADKSRDEDLELPVFNFSTIAIATQNFSEDNKLGQGGFGPVHKGTLQSGQEIAVKRLSKDSNQGLDQFKNEVAFIAKLQHRNLVKLLGCCIDLEEKILVYEYMPNRSLDAFIFDQEQRKLLDLPMRLHIINGIARGILYLHQDSRLRIIHRDLKASNILLDYDMNPKISDFGMARSFTGNEIQGKTKKVAGTYGYMSPEYAVDGLFSIKSDVYSFGVLVLEITSGMRNRGFYHPDHSHNLLGHAWMLYKEGRALELIDQSVRDFSSLSEVLRSIHVGLLCVQQSPEDRPDMSNVVLMLSSDVALPEPEEPGFFTERELFNLEGPLSNNDITISSLIGR